MKCGDELLRKARTIADYQFGSGAGEALFPKHVEFEFILTRSGRMSQIKDKDNGMRIATLRSLDGLFTLGIAGAVRLHRFLEYPRMRVVMNNAVSEYIRAGGTAFCKHVIDVDPEIRAYDEVIVVDERDNLLATGKAMLSPEEMRTFEHGVAVKVRYGVEKT